VERAGSMELRRYRYLSGVSSRRQQPHAPSRCDRSDRGSVTQERCVGLRHHLAGKSRGSECIVPAMGGAAVRGPQHIFTAVRPPHQEWATRHVPQSNTSSATIGEWAIPKPCSRQPTAKQLRRVRASTGEMGPGGCGPLPIVRNPERRTDLLRIGYDVHVMPA
jgi:hypothetical protein